MNPVKQVSEMVQRATDSLVHYFGRRRAVAEARETQLRFKVARGRQAAFAKESEIFKDWLTPYADEYRAELEKQLYDGATPEIREEARVALKTIHNLMVVRIDDVLREGQEAQAELDEILKQKPKKDKAVK
jgi:hypothetical protein